MTDTSTAFIVAADQACALTQPSGPRVWSAPTEPDDVTAVRDRNGHRWVCPGRPGDNLWWAGNLGDGTGYEWHELLVESGPLTEDTGGVR